MDDRTPAPAARGGRRWLELAVLFAVLGAALVGAALWSSARPRPAGDAPRPFAVARVTPAEPAPDFTLPDLAGRPVRLQDFRGRVVLLNFWATWCEPCRQEIPAMQELVRELEPRGLVLLAVNYQETPAQAAAFARDVKLTGLVLLDADGAAAQRFHVTGLPASFFIDRNGVLVGSVLGYRDWRLPAARTYVMGLLGGAG